MLRYNVKYYNAFSAFILYAILRIYEAQIIWDTKLPHRQGRLMQIPSRFSIGVHICLCLEFFNQDSDFNRKRLEQGISISYCKKMTSEALAESVGVNSVIIRNLLSDLKNAGLVHIARGIGGAFLAKRASDISLLDIFSALHSAGDPESRLFRFHANPSQLCPLGKNIHHLLEGHFVGAQSALEQYLDSISLEALLKAL